MMQWLQSGWYGGNATDQFIGIANSFQSGKNLEIRQEPKGVKLAKKVTHNSGTISDLILKFITIQSTGDVIAFGDTGKIYRQVAGTGNFTLVYTDTTNRKIINAYEYNSYLYWATSGHLNRIAVANIDNSWAGDVTENYKAFTNGNTTYHPMIEVFNKLYIGDGKSLAELDSFGTFTGSKITIFNDEQIVILTFNGTRVKLYSQRTSNVEYGRFYVWDAVSASYNEFIPLGKTPWCGIEKDNIDFMIAGRQPTLYAVNGYSLQPIKQIPGFSDGNSAIFSQNNMAVMDNNILFGSVYSGTNSINRGVWTFGAKDKEYPQVLNFDFQSANASTSDTIGAVHYANGKVYMSVKNGSSYWIDETDNTKYATTGELISRAWEGGAGHQKKELKTLKIAFKQLAAGEQIDIYLRRDLTSNWGSAILTAAYSDTADQGKNYKELSSNALGDPFNYLEIKAVLTAGTSQATTPTLLDIYLTSDFIEVQ